MSNRVFHFFTTYDWINKSRLLNVVVRSPPLYPRGEPKWQDNYPEGPDHPVAPNRPKSFLHHFHFWPLVQPLPFLTSGPDLGAWPDCWVSVEFLHALIPRKGSGSTTTSTFFLGEFWPLITNIAFFFMSSSWGCTVRLFTSFFALFAISRKPQVIDCWNLRLSTQNIRFPIRS